MGHERVSNLPRDSFCPILVRPMTGSSARPHTMCVWHPQNRVINLQARNSDTLRVWMSAVGKHISIANSLQDSRPEWEENTSSCTLCDKSFGLFTRPHHCRNCGRCVCSTYCSRRARIQGAHFNTLETHRYM